MASERPLITQEAPSPPGRSIPQFGRDDRKDSSGKTESRYPVHRPPTSGPRQNVTGRLEAERRSPSGDTWGRSGGGRA